MYIVHFFLARATPPRFYHAVCRFFSLSLSGLSSRRFCGPQRQLLNDSMLVLCSNLCLGSDFGRDALTLSKADHAIGHFHCTFGRLVKSSLFFFFRRLLSCLFSSFPGEELLKSPKVVVV